MNKPVYDSFEGYHPMVNFIYFTTVFMFAMLMTNPLARVISLFSALCYAFVCEGKKALGYSLRICLPITLLTAFINPAFSHEGVTVLMYFPTGNPLTLESIIYGLSMGIMMASAMVWFYNFNRVITSDKFVYLFGRIIPAMSLILSMTLRFVPKFTNQMKTVAEAQKGLGRDISEGSVLQRIKKAVTVLSIMVTWALENAIETADSMKSRGYGLKGRTAFSIYRFDERDKMMIIWIAFCAVYLLAGCVSSAFMFRYFPGIRWTGFSPIVGSFYIVYFLICITPAVLNKLEDRKWNFIHFEI